MPSEHGNNQSSLLVSVSRATLDRGSEDQGGGRA